MLKITIDAFALSPQLNEVFGQVAANRVLSKSRVNIVNGGLANAPAYYSDKPSAQLIIVEERGSDSEMLEHLAKLAEVCEPGTRVVVIGTLNDIAIYRQLMSQGISEYLVEPVTAAAVIDAISAVFHDPSALPRGRSIAFFGARGGVGSSTLAHNAAWNLSQLLDEDVVLADLDLSFGTATLAFNLESRQPLAEALAQPDRIDNVLLERFLVKYDERLEVLGGEANLAVTGAPEVEALDRVIDISRQMAGFVVLDLPHIWADWTEYAMNAADELVIVATPDLPNLRECKNLLDRLATSRGDAPTRILLNRMDAYRKSQLTAKDFQETLNLPPMAVIPFDPTFGLASNNGQMIGQIAKGGKLAETLRQVSLQLAGRQGQAAGRKASSGMFSWMVKGA